MKHPVKITRIGNRIEVESYYFPEKKQDNSIYNRVVIMLRYIIKKLRNA
jgi:hypothetical protein